jgi:signal transduction histidine kinase
VNTAPNPGGTVQKMASIQTSLTAKVLWVIAGLSLVLVVLVSAIEIHQQGEDLIAQQQREATAVVMANRDALSLSLWSLDQRTLETLARSLVRGTSIFRAELVEDGKVQLSTSRQILHADRSWQIPLLRPGGHQILGVLRLYENYDQDRRQVRRNAAMLVIGELTKVLALSLIVFFLVHIWITRPLAQLAAKVQDNAAAGSGGPIVIQRPLHGGRDEIDALVDAVNHNQQERRRLEAEADVRRAREARTGKLAALGQLAGGIAHDFNNILGAILGFGGLLAQDGERGSPAEHYVQRMMAAAERGRDLVKQILTFARAGDVDRSIVDLAQIVRQSENLLLAALPKSTRLEFAYAAEALPVSGNGVRLGQLVVNLCINASEALEGGPGTVRLDVSRAPPDELREPDTRMAAGEFFTGSLDPARAYARLRISDSGEGIAPELLDRIFEPFFTTKPPGQGLGLGLDNAMRIVRKHRGHISVRSEPGNTCFRVRLPLDQLQAY